MRVTICEDKRDVGFQAAQAGALKIQQAIATKGSAVIVLATGASQFEMLDALVQRDVDWSKVEAFQLDEYVGIPDSHPASFQKYLRDRFMSQVKNLKAFHAIDGSAENPEAEAERLSALIAERPVDVMFLGIGENGHLAFNNPPANFDTEEPYLVVTLTERCRKQQVGEGWFPCIDDVPVRAISMSIRQILRSRSIVCSVPDKRKARAVAMCLYDQISPLSPCSVLRRRNECSLFLDRPSSMLVFGDRR